MAVIRTLGILIAVWASLLPGPASAQRGGSGAPSAPSGGGAPTGGGRGPAGSGISIPTTNNPPTSTPGSGNSQPIFISGRVLVDDSSPLPTNVTIERVCGPAHHAEGHTDSKGYFGVQLGAANVDAFLDPSSSNFPDLNRPGFSPDAGGTGNSTNGGLAERALVGCELRANIPGYTSQSVDLSMRRPMDNPEVGTILVHRISRAEGTTVSASSLAAPKNAKKALQKGYALEKKNELDQARADFQQAVDTYPQYAEAWFELGRMQARQGQAELAHKSFDEAIRAEPRYIPPYIQLSLLEMQAQRWKELVDISDKALRLAPFGYPQVFFMNAVANYNLGRGDVAEKSVRRALALDTRHQLPHASHLLGVILADRQDYAGAAAQMRDYLKFAPQGADVADVRARLEVFEKQSAAQAH